MFLLNLLNRGREKNGDFVEYFYTFFAKILINSITQISDSIYHMTLHQDFAI